MLVTLSEYSELAHDANGNVLPLGQHRTACQARTAAGAFAALGGGTRFVRLATDTAIQMDVTGGSTDATDELFPAGHVEFIAVFGGETLTIATV